MDYGKLLIYVNSDLGTATILQGSIPEFETLIQDVLGDDLSNWPQDFGAYEKGNGLYVFEGELDEEGDNQEDDRGSVRNLTPAEWRWLQTNEYEGF